VVRNAWVGFEGVQYLCAPSTHILGGFQVRSVAYIQLPFDPPHTHKLDQHQVYNTREMETIVLAPVPCTATNSVVNDTAPQFQAWTGGSLEGDATAISATSDMCEAGIIPTAPITIPNTAGMLECTEQQQSDARDGWTQLFAIYDDRTKDDLPNTKAEIAAGFGNDNAFYIGNEALNRLDILSAEICAGACGSVMDCHEIDNVQAAARTFAPTSLNTDLKKSIGCFTGQCESASGCCGEGYLMYGDFPNWKLFDGTTWSYGSYTSISLYSDADWHTDGSGMTMKSARCSGLNKTLRSMMLLNPPSAFSPLSSGWQSSWLVLDDVIESPTCWLGTSICVIQWHALLVSLFSPVSLSVLSQH
jgi:hypothetical protein